MLYVFQNMYKCVGVWRHINQNRERPCQLVVQSIGRERNGEGSHDLGPKQRVRLCLNKETTSFHKVSNEEKYFQTQFDDLLLYRTANRIWTMTSDPGWNEVGKVPIDYVSNSSFSWEKLYSLNWIKNKHKLLGKGRKYREAVVGTVDYAWARQD